MKLKIPPPVSVILCGVIMWSTNRIIHPIVLSHSIRLSLFVAFAVVGLILIVTGAVLFKLAHTTADPAKPNSASHLVTSGPYRFTRNPMYLGLLTILLGWACFLANVLTLICMIGFYLYMSEFQIKPEEQALLGLFGSDFAAYKAKVRRWI
jgi:protein-S-isoprenylcysteine O-methyltransferase Ste14